MGCERTVLGLPARKKQAEPSCASNTGGKAAKAAGSAPNAAAGPKTPQ